MPQRLRAAYESVDALVKDVREQLGKGGLLVKGNVPSGLQMYAAVELEVACAAAGSVVVSAQVLQTFPGMGVAVSIDAGARATIEALATGGPALEATGERANTASEDAPAHEASEPDGEPALDDDGDGETDGDASRPGGGPAATARTAKPGASTMEKIQKALRGDRDARTAVLRDRNRMIHVHVLRNPGLTLDEIAAMARMTTVAVEVLKQIAERREWGHRPEIAIALIRNPTVPPAIAIGLLDHVNPAELRQLAKDSRTREPIQRAARRKILT